MSNRAVKKIKEKQILDAIEKKSQQVQQGEDDEEETESVATKEKRDQNFFSMMDDQDDDEPEEQNNEESNLKQESQTGSNDQKDQSQEGQDADQKKKKKQNKQKQQPVLTQEEIQQKEMDELDKILKENGFVEEQKNSEEEKKDIDGEDLGDTDLVSPLQLILVKFNYNQELSKYFQGARLTDEAEEDQQGGGGVNKLNQRQAQAVSALKKQASIAMKKYNLVHTDQFFQPVEEKFALKELEENEFGQKVYAFLPSTQYEVTQKDYQLKRNSYDPQQIFEFTQYNPYHIDGLYNVEEFFRLQGNFKQANSLLEKILFIYESSFGSSFGRIFTDTKNEYTLSIGFNQYASTLYLALHKFIDILGKKGCYRAALEYNKFLLQLDPFNDPTGALLSLDYNAFSSKEFDYLNYFGHQFAEDLYKDNKVSILYLPNYSISVAVGLFSQIMFPPEVKKKVVEGPPVGEQIKFTDSDFEQALEFIDSSKQDDHKVLILTAILLYPRLIRDVIEANQFQKQTVSHSILSGWQQKGFQEILEHQFFKQNDSLPLYSFLSMENEDDITGLQKTFEIYVERTKLIWKNTTIILWVKAAVGFILNKIDEEIQGKPKFDYNAFLQTLISKSGKNKLPFQLRRYKGLSKSNFSDRVERLDLNNIQDHQNVNNPNQLPANYNPIDVNQGLFTTLLQSLLPWYHLPQGGQNGGGGDDNDFQDFEQDF